MRLVSFTFDQKLWRGEPKNSKERNTDTGVKDCNFLITGAMLTSSRSIFVSGNHAFSWLSLAMTNNSIFLLKTTESTENLHNDL